MGALKINLMNLIMKIIYFLNVPKHSYLPFLTSTYGFCSTKFFHKKFEKAKPGLCVIFPIALLISLSAPMEFPIFTEVERKDDHKEPNRIICY